MQTTFTAEQLADASTARSNEILRSCVHCGFCTATCPTYMVLGDELDSPRGRIYLIKDMLENGKVPDGQTVKHIDRCLSCLSCMTTCPSACITCIWSTTHGNISREITSAVGTIAHCVGFWRESCLIPAGSVWH
jgi:ferredoxin